MPMKRLALAVALLLPTTLMAQTPPPPAPAPAPATTPPPGENIAGAKMHFDQGNALYNDGNYSAALAEFLESYRQKPTTVVLYNIGMTQKALFRYAEAVEWLEKYLAESTNLPPERRAEVLGIVNEIRALLAEVTVQVTPDNATVTVDGRGVGNAPLPKPLQIAAGNHTIEASAEGFVTQKRDVMISAGVPISVKLALKEIPRTGKVRVTSTIPQAMVAIDGKVIGAAPVETELVAGGHTLEVSAPKYELHREELVVAVGQTREVPVRLEHTIVKRPWYQEWYVWTPIAAVVAGTAIGLGVGLGTRQSPVEGTLAPNIGGVQ
jgi:hypothetical protein